MIAVRLRPWPLDLLLVILMAVLGAGAVVLDWPPVVRIPFGLALVLFLPGYALASALFPQRNGPDGAERVALGFGLSLANIPFVALALDYSRWSISTNPLVVSLTAVTVIAAVISVERRRRRPTSDRFGLQVALPPLPDPRGWSRQARITVGLAVMALLFLGAGGIPVVVNRMSGDPLTEFALYNEAGDPRFYPRQVGVGEPVTVRLSVANHEGKTTVYDLLITGSGRAVDPLPRITLVDGETWTGEVRFTVDEAGEALPVQFELWRLEQEGDGEPYRALRLMMDGSAVAVDGTG